MQLLHERGVDDRAAVHADEPPRIEPRLAPARKSPGALEQFIEGWTYAFGFRPIRSIILLLALVSLVGVPYSVLMPIFVSKAKPYLDTFGAVVAGAKSEGSGVTRSRFVVTLR